MIIAFKYHQQKLWFTKVAGVIFFNKPMIGSKETSATSEGAWNTKISQHEWAWL